MEYNCRLRTYPIILVARDGIVAHFPLEYLGLLASGTANSSKLVIACI